MLIFTQLSEPYRGRHCIVVTLNLSLCRRLIIIIISTSKQGEHKIILSKEAERIELTHKALDRSIYAKGALAGAKWLNSKPNGLYSMLDIYS